MNEDKTALEDFLEGRDQFDIDPLTVPVELAGSSEWDTMDDERRSRILGGMLRHTVQRAIEHVALYRDDPAWQNVGANDIASISDLQELPLISKDSLAGTGSPERPGIYGFRSAVLEDPNVLVPGNLRELLKIQEVANPNHPKILAKCRGRPVLEFGSGGSKGKSTLTKLTYLSVEAEAYALSRALVINGFRRGDSIACFYAPDHKGGWQLERAADIMGMDFHSKDRIFAELKLDPKYSMAIVGFQHALATLKRDDLSTDEREDAELRVAQHSPLVRLGIRGYIRSHGIQVIESVQPSQEFVNKNAKGGALAFMTIYNEDPSAFVSVNHVFLTGFPVPAFAYDHLRADGKEVSTTWGSTETMALATCIGRRNVNDLAATPFPTVGQVVWYRERDESKPQVMEPSIGLEGLLLVTGLLGAGSTYLNYMIGDIAMRTERGYRDIHRISSNDIAGSCAADALSV